MQVLVRVLVMSLGLAGFAAAGPALAGELVSINSGDVTLDAELINPNISESNKSALSIFSAGTVVKKSYTYTKLDAEGHIISTTNEETSSIDSDKTNIISSNSGQISTTGEFTVDGSHEGSESSLSISACGVCTTIYGKPNSSGD